MRFRAGWWMAGAAALTLGTACEERDRGAQEQASGQSTVNDQVAQAQQRTESAFDSARQAQEQASEQQKQASSAQQELQDKQREYQEAQAKAHSAAQQAQQAQQGAQQQKQEAQQAQRQQSETLAQQNQQARQQSEQLRQQSQQPVAVAPPPQTQPQGAQTQQQGAQAQQGSEQQVVGEVLSASDQELLLSSQGEPQLRLQVSPETQVMVDGRQANVGDIEEGSQVRASYRTDAQSGEPQAVRIEATSQVQPTAPAAPESGESTPGSQPTQ
ncbi:hypothetical protein [Corallococcus macrosporus]|nr:hypothetical protein [Corallococcus macrosporus]